MDINFIEFIILVLIFGCIFILVLNMLFKELFDLYETIKEIEIRSIVITLVSLGISILFIKLLNIKFTVSNLSYIKNYLLLKYLKMTYYGGFY
ncbi:protein of unknown function [Methanocaldococcus lauensis]|uniref:Uncharacterized protein n=1 Tax=Methanocaldococcus lauensis TaxID=2546128 RepID=A0A8D6SWG3_9EURY|nr:hypothetical protein [Methanocaldococcus lauensis]CAB3289363.1 protein of unknown function [Methanocaldococcus lauensis]